MTAPQILNNTDLDTMQTIFAKQKSAFDANPYPSATQRIQALKKLKQLY